DRRAGEVWRFAARNGIADGEHGNAHGLGVASLESGADTNRVAKCVAPTALEILFLRFSQPLRAGLTCVAPPALGAEAHDSLKQEAFARPDPSCVRARSS